MNSYELTNIHPLLLVGNNPEYVNFDKHIIPRHVTYADIVKYTIVSELSANDPEFRKKMIRMLIEKPKALDVPITSNLKVKCDVVWNLMSAGMLKIFEDRIRYVGFRTQYNQPALKRAGVKLSTLFQPLVSFIERTENFKYSNNVLSFLSGLIDVSLTMAGDLKYTIKDKTFKDYTFGALYGDEYPDNAVLFIKYSDASTTIDRDREIFTFLLAVYIYGHRTWYNSGKWHEYKGMPIYLHNHSLRLNRTYNQKDRYFKNQLPFGISPNEYFKEFIDDHIKKLYLSYIETDKQLAENGFVVPIHNPKYRQLLTMADMVNEGNQMQHCIGTNEYYIHSFSLGKALNFHIDIDGYPHGITLSLSSKQPREVNDNPPTPFEIQYADRYWEIEECKGFQNKDIDDIPNAKDAVNDFLLTYFNYKGPKPRVVTTPEVDDSGDYIIHAVPAPITGDDAVIAQREVTNLFAPEVVIPPDNMVFEVSLNRSSVVSDPDSSVIEMRHKLNTWSLAKGTLSVVYGKGVEGSDEQHNVYVSQKREDESFDGWRFFGFYGSQIGKIKTKPSIAHSLYRDILLNRNYLNYCHLKSPYLDIDKIYSPNLLDIHMENNTGARGYFLRDLLATSRRESGSGRIELHVNSHTFPISMSIHELSLRDKSLIPLKSDIILQPGDTIKITHDLRYDDTIILTYDVPKTYRRSPLGVSIEQEIFNMR